MLQPTGLAVLADLGLADQIIAHGHQIDHLIGYITPSMRRVLDVGYAGLNPNYFGLSVQRSAVFDILFSEVQKEQIAFRSSFDVTHSETVNTDKLVLVSSLDDMALCGQTLNGRLRTTPFLITHFLKLTKKQAKWLALCQVVRRPLIQYKGLLFSGASNKRIIQHGAKDRLIIGSKKL